MAKQNVTVWVDDTDETQAAAETVRFALDGAEYTIDLSSANANAIRGEFGSWIEKAARVHRARGKKTMGRSIAAKHSPK